jgi:hypothetical protein
MINNHFGGKVFTANLTTPNGIQRTMADAMREDAHRLSTQFGLDCTNEGLKAAYSNL